MYNNWINWKTDPHPIDRRMQGLGGMGSENTRFVINELVRLNGNYLEVGSFRGDSLIAAAMYNDSKCIGIDNYCQFKGAKDSCKILQQRIGDYPNIEFYKQDWRGFVPDEEINVFFYDGNHTKDETIEAVEYFSQFVNGYIVIDDIDFKGPSEALKILRRDYKVVFEVHSDTKDSPIWWNGIAVLLS